MEQPKETARSHSEPAKPWRGVASVFGFLAVGLGAFGAHGLESVFETYQTGDIWETASTYHLAHALAAWMAASVGIGWRKPTLWFLLGITVFSGSLYVLAVTDMRWLGMITPIGGLSFLVGWIFLAIDGLRNFHRHG